MTLLLEAIKIALTEYLYKQQKTYEYDINTNYFTGIHIYNDATHRQTFIYHHKDFIVVYSKSGKSTSIPNCHPQLLTEIITAFKGCQRG